MSWVWKWSWGLRWTKFQVRLKQGNQYTPRFRLWSIEWTDLENERIAWNWIDWNWIDWFMTFCTGVEKSAFCDSTIKSKLSAVDHWLLVVVQIDKLQPQTDSFIPWEFLKAIGTWIPHSTNPPHRSSRVPSSSNLPTHPAIPSINCPSRCRPQQSVEW